MHVLSIDIHIWMYVSIYVFMQTIKKNKKNENNKYSIYTRTLYTQSLKEQSKKKKNIIKIIIIFNPNGMCKYSLKVENLSTHTHVLQYACKSVE